MLPEELPAARRSEHGGSRRGVTLSLDQRLAPMAGKKQIARSEIVRLDLGVAVEVHDRPTRPLVSRPRGYPGAVGIAGAREVRPIALHECADLVIGVGPVHLWLGGEFAEDVEDF